MRYPSCGMLLEQVKKILTKVCSPVYFGFVVIRDNLSLKIKNVFPRTLVFTRNSGKIELYNSVPLNSTS